MKIEVCGEYVSFGDEVVKVDAIVALSRVSATSIKIAWANSSIVSTCSCDGEESTDKVWTAITSVMRKYSK